MTRELLSRWHRVARERDALVEETVRTYPVGTVLRVKIQRNHKTPSIVKVVSHCGGVQAGELRVEVLDSRNGRRHDGSGFVTTVDVTQVLEVVHGSGF